MEEPKSEVQNNTTVIEAATPQAVPVQAVLPVAVVQALPGLSIIPLNWRTSVHAFILAALMGAKLLAPDAYQTKIQGMFDILVISGFLTAADAANSKR